VTAPVLIALSILTNTVLGSGLENPKLDRFVQKSSVIVHGTVEAVDSCTASNDNSAWTFVEIDVIQVLRGSILPHPGNFTVRLPAGEFSDGSFGSGFAVFCAESQEWKREGPVG